MTSRTGHLLATLAVCLANAAASQDDATQSAAPSPWTPELVDPGPVLGSGEPADLILPLPCGGGMAFQRVAVPTDVASPLSDRPFRMGQSDANTGFSDYLQPTHLRGPFIDTEAATSYYYIARYEMNIAQYRAITGDCTEPFTRRDQFAKGDLSWFDAVNVLRDATEWVLKTTPDAMPADGDRVGFLRLPTEAEWEFAARGGIKADPSVFLGRRFFDSGSLSEYAHYQAPGQGRGKLRPVGIRQPNPLGIYDIYGNAEELMLEPYRLNAIGRRHGQPGGLVTRGGSIDTEETWIYTAQRREYPLFLPQTGSALVGTFFGVRPVISAHIMTDASYDAIQQGWIAEADRVPEGAGDPSTALSNLLEDEVDPRRKEALTSLQLEFRLAREAAEESLAQTAKSTLLSGAIFVDTIVEDSNEIASLVSQAQTLRDLAANSPPSRTQTIIQQWTTLNVRIGTLRESLRTFLLSYRSALETLNSDITDDQRTSAFESLKSDLEGSGQLQLLARLGDFWEDLFQYQLTPDMSENQLLSLAVDVQNRRQQALQQQ